MSKFTWGDEVEVSKDYFVEEYREMAGIICGIDTVSSENRSERLRCSIGDQAYIVEFINGSDIEVAEKFLSKKASKI